MSKSTPDFKLRHHPSLEALAMEFDGHQTNWEDIDSKKRIAIDLALKSASEEIKNDVKKAIITGEHVLLKQRFKKFTLAYLPQDFFLEGAEGQLSPIGRLELSDALDFAYEIRSKYIHELRQLPYEITDSLNYGERVTTVDYRTAITFQGLYRLARSVVLEFVQRQPKKDFEPYNYLLETGAARKIRFSASVWMHPDAVSADNGKQWFEGFAETYCQAIISVTERTMPDLKSILDRAAPLFESMSQQNRRAYVALVAASRICLPVTFHASNQNHILKRWGNLLNCVGPETLLLHMLADMLPPWSISEHASALENHLRLRSKPSGFKFPRRLDAALILDLAERYRLQGTWQEAYNTLILACENFPEFQELRDLALRANSKTELRAEGILFPRKNQAM